VCDKTHLSIIVSHHKIEALIDTSDCPGNETSMDIEDNHGRGHCH